MSAEIVRFPRQPVASPGTDGQQRLQRALQALEEALAGQRAAIADWRNALGSLGTVMSGLAIGAPLPRQPRFAGRAGGHPEWPGTRAGTDGRRGDGQGFGSVKNFCPAAKWFGLMNTPSSSAPFGARASCVLPAGRQTKLPAVQSPSSSSRLPSST